MKTWLGVLTFLLLNTDWDPITQIIYIFSMKLGWYVKCTFAYILILMKKAVGLLGKRY